MNGLGHIQRHALKLLASRPEGCGTTDLGLKVRATATAASPTANEPM